MKRVLFTIAPHSMVDVITNSSSELFVSNKPKDVLLKLIEEVYPNYLDEYEPLKGIRELSNDDIECYIGYHYDYWSNSRQCTVEKLIPGFTHEEMYGHTDDWRWNLVTDETRQRVIDGIDPNGNMFFLFSRDQNPDWEKQELLMDIMTRYHLG